MVGDLNCKHRDWNSRLNSQNGKRLRKFAYSRRVTVIGPHQPTFYPALPIANPDVLDIAVTQGIACPVEVISFTVQSLDHKGVSVHVANQHAFVRETRKVIDWPRYGPTLCRRLPAANPFETVRQLTR